MKDYLTYENQRNKTHHDLYRRILDCAFGNCAVIGHHICFNVGEDLNEIPSADCLIFDHDIMSKVFGGQKYLAVMTSLALVPVSGRDEMLAHLFETRGSK